LSSKKFSLNEAGSEAPPSKARKCFNDLLVESFLESMEFGEVVLYFLELRSSIRREEIAERPDKFARELEDLFGDGAKVILERTVKTLYEKLGLSYVRKRGYEFSDYVGEAYQEYLRRKH
jgi:hypothetical protein